MPAYIPEVKPTGRSLWEGMSKEYKREIIDRIEAQLNDELFDELFDLALWRGIKDADLYDYLKDKVYLTVSFK